MVFPGLGPMELAIILAIILVLFGYKNLPKLAKSVGESVKVFRESSSDKEEPEEEKIKKLAEDLGIATEGKSLDEIKKELEDKVSKLTKSGES